VQDEIFHVPQAQKYCKGNFREWDQKITTLPGSYLIAASIAGPLSYLTSSVCTLHLILLQLTSVATCTPVLRIVHVLFVLGLGL
jgi:hypothetical protein